MQKSPNQQPILSTNNNSIRIKKDPLRSQQRKPQSLAVFEENLMRGGPAQQFIQKIGPAPDKSTWRIESTQLSNNA